MADWITIYSPIVLWQVLQQQYWNCWILFVKAVKMISGRVLGVSELSEADVLMQEFVNWYRNFMGTERVL